MMDSDPVDFYVQRFPIDNINAYCSEAALIEWESDYDTVYVICYVMANMSNGARIASGSYQNYKLLPPFDQAFNGFKYACIRVTNLSS